MDKRLDSLADLIKQTRRELSDAEWEGDWMRSNVLEAQLLYYEQLVAEGELYVPNF